jgi:ABC-type xylose transport system substrate-binding protein
MYVDFQAARYSFFDQLSGKIHDSMTFKDGSFVKIFSPLTSENYRVEKDSKIMNKECKEWIDKKFLKETNNSSQVFYHLESMMEKVIRELILKEKAFL